MEDKYVTYYYDDGKYSILQTVVNNYPSDGKLKYVLLNAFNQKLWYIEDILSRNYIIIWVSERFFFFQSNDL